MKKSAYFLYHCLFAGMICFLALGCEDDDIPEYCREDPTIRSCPNYDPCFFTVPIPTAEWDMVDTATFQPVDSAIAFVMDTARSQRAATGFRPRYINERAIYRWQIGLDPRIWETPYFVPPGSFFSEVEGPLSITLEIEQPDFNDCISENEAIRSFTKTVFFKRVTGPEEPMLGTFQGEYFDEQGRPSGNGEISIVFEGDSELYRRVIQGLAFPGPCGFINENGVVILGSLYQGVSSISGSAADCFRAISPVVLVDLDQETATQLTVDIWYDDPDTGERIYKKFVGQRI